MHDSNGNFDERGIVDRYTFGKPLTNAEVLVTVKFSYYYDRYGNKTQPTLQKRGTVSAIHSPAEGNGKCNPLSSKGGWLVPESGSVLVEEKTTTDISY